MSLTARLERCKAYREEAIKQPQKNKLYIEDLDLSIEYMESAVKHNTIVVGKNWVDS